MSDEEKSLRQQFLAAWSGDDKTPEEQLRALAQYLLIVPLIMIVLFVVGQLALLGRERIAAGETGSALSADYGPWSYLPIKVAGEGLLQDLQQEAVDATQVSMLGSDPEDVGGAFLDQTPDAEPQGGTQAAGEEEDGSVGLEPVATTESPSQPSGGQWTFTPEPTSTSTMPNPSVTHTPTSPPPVSTPSPTASPRPTSTPTDDISEVDWWNAAYRYRQPIRVSAGAASVPSGYTVSITFDHEGLVRGGKALINGNDLRIVRNTTSGWQEVDRVLGVQVGWNQASTVILFQLQNSVSANQTDGSYYLYYGNPSAASPPADPQRVYWYFSDFSDPGSLADWTQRDVAVNSNWSISGGVLRHDSNASQTGVDPRVNSKLVLTARPQIRDLVLDVTINPQDKDLTSFGLCSNDTNPAGFYVGISADMWFHETSAGSRVGYWLNAGDHADSIIVYILNASYPMRYHWTSNRIQVNALNLQYSWNSGPTSPGYFCIALNSMNGVQFDDMRIRRYVNPEPSLSLQAEETR